MTAARTEREKARAAERNARNERVPFDWQIVKVEQSSMCDAAWLAENKIKACGVFYLYDANRHVHICSFQPTYELHAICGYAESAIAGDMTEEESNALNEFELEMLASEEHPVEYMDPGQVDHMPRQPATCAPEREAGEDCETYYHRACEEMREYLQGNPPWF